MTYDETRNVAGKTTTNILNLRCHLQTSREWKEPASK